MDKKFSKLNPFFNFKNKILNSDVKIEIRIFNIYYFTCFTLTTIIGILDLTVVWLPRIALIFLGLSLVMSIVAQLANKYDIYNFVYCIMVIITHLILVPILFLLTGGHKGYLPALFVFSITNTFMLLRKKTLMIIVSIEIVLYSFIYYLCFNHPNLIVDYKETTAYKVNLVTIVLATGIILGISFYLCLYIYRKNNEQLVDAQKKALDYNNEKNLFFSNINHALRTPLHIILGMNEMISRDSNSDTIIEYAKNSTLAGKSLQTLINKLVIYSRVETGNVSAMNINFSLQEILDDIITSTDSECSKEKIEFDFDISTNIPDFAKGDSILLQQVINNLVYLSISQNNGGSIYLNFYWEPVSTQKGNIHFILEHASLKSELVSNKFTNTNYDINMIQSIVDLLGGTFDIYFPTTMRCNIHISIPLINDNISGNTSIQSDSSLFTAQDATLLLVDDNEMNLEVVSLLLNRTKIKIDTAQNGYEALDLIESNMYDMMLIDYMMPEMNGVELVKNIKHKYPDIYNITPIYALSAAINQEARQLLFKAGFKGYIPKPVDSKTLEHIIKANLSPELINEIDADDNPDKISHDDIIEYGKILKSYDICLSDGLKYMSDDFLQYVSTTEIMVKTYDKNRKNIESCMKNEDIKNIGIAAHALKGNAKFVGADLLSRIALTIEEKASEQDINYIKNALPLLYYEWEKIIDGLLDFQMAFNQSEYAKKHKSHTETINTDNYLDDIIEYVDNFESEPAIKLIEEVFYQHLDPDNETILKKVSDYLDDYEYDKAMNLLKEIIS